MSTDYDLKAKTLIKEYMANMPDTINSKKECDEYYKAGWKEIKEKIKEEKKADKAATKNAEPKKRVKKVEVDDDGNEIEKVKKPLNAYNKYIQEQRPNVKNDFPDLSNKEIFSKIAEMWKKHKEDIKNKVDSNDSNDSNDSDKGNDSDKNIKEDDKEKSPQKAEPKKRVKKEKN